MKKITSKVKQGVILAAGRGSRIFPLSKNYPKTLLPILNKPLMQYQIKVLRDSGIEDIITVIGDNGRMIKDFFGDGTKFGVRMSYIVDGNPQGIASSLNLAKARIKGPFFLFLGDIFVSDANIQSSLKLFDESDVDSVIIGREETDQELVKRNFSIISGRNGLILRVIEKPKKVTSMFKGYGLYIFSPAIFEAISKTPKSKLRNEVEITDSIQTLIDSGGKVRADKWKNWDFNLSYPEDLLMCNLKMLKENKLKNLIGLRVLIDKGAEMIKSVVGDRARVSVPSVFEECLIFADTDVNSKMLKLKQARRMIFFDDQALEI